MSRLVNVALIAAFAFAAWPTPLPAATPQQPDTATSLRLNACSLVPKEEVRKYLPWMAALDGLAIEEEAIGAAGSSCNYPSVFIQVLPFSQGTIDAARKKGGLETIRAIGDEAYFYNNADQYAELYVKVGTRLLTLQANVDDNMESVKPGVLNLAKALVAKLR